MSRVLASSAIREFKHLSAGCTLSLMLKQPSGLAGAWEALVTYDSLIVGLTLWRTMKERRDRRITGINVTLVDVLLRDGKPPFDRLTRYST